MNEPLVLPVTPVIGWRTAGTARRVLAVAVLPLVLTWAVLLAYVPGPGDVVTAVTGMTVGPAAFWSLARVLRPHVSTGVERQLRHAIAATATCMGTAVIVGIAVNTSEGSYLMAFASLASFGFVVTVPWGLIALVVRACRTPVPVRAY